MAMRTTALHPDTNRAIRLRPSVAAAAALTLVLLGMAARGSLAPEGSTSVHEAPLDSGPDDLGDRPAGPTTMKAGIPVGYAQTRQGAIAAAAGYVTTGQVLLDLDPAGVEAAVRTMAATGAAEAQLADTTARLDLARDALTGSDSPIDYHQAVLAVRVDSFTPQRSRVAVWNVGVLSRDGVAPPQAGWAVSTFDLVWEQSDWKIWAESIVPGPAAITNNAVTPASSPELRARLAGFTDYEAAR